MRIHALLRAAPVLLALQLTFAQDSHSDRLGNTTLIQAAVFGAADSLEAGLKQQPDVNGRNAFDATALILAAADERKAHLLIDHGADVNAHSRMGRTPLGMAASCDGCSRIVRLLLAKGADPNYRDKGGMTPLWLAAQAGDADSVRALLDAGARVDTPSNDGTTPLMHAVQNCNLDSIKLLLAHHADVHKGSVDGGTVKFGPIQLTNLTPLHYAAPYCSTDVVRALLDAGADPNVRDGRGMTPLMLSVASETQDAAVVRVLLHAGADLTAKTKLGETAYDWARKYNNKDVLAQLTAAGAWAPEYAPLAEHRRETPVEPAVAVERAVTLLQRSSVEFFKQSGCVGCHHQMMTIAAVTAARNAAVHVDDAGARSLVQMIESDWTRSQEALLERFDPGGLADPEGYAAWVLGMSGYAPTPLTETVAIHVAALQHQDGRWHVGDASRSPIQESDIARTARAIYVLRKYAPAGRRAEFDARIGRAAAWLADALAVTNDDAAMQVVGLRWGGATARIASLGAKLRAAQRADGGWAQNPNLASDAFATGESLWALREAGLLQPDDPTYRRGVAYLLTSQYDDGTWHVRSRAPKFQPYFQSGFPYEHDQWISAAATAWAVLAISPIISKAPAPPQR